MQTTTTTAHDYADMKPRDAVDFLETAKDVFLAVSAGALGALGLYAFVLAMFSL